MPIRYGAHCFLFTERWNDDDLPYFEKVRNLGLEHFEIAVGDDVSFNLKEARQRAEDLGLQLTLSPGNIWPFECDLSSDNPEERELGLAWHKKWVDAASLVGAAAYTGALYGHPGTVKKRDQPKEESLWTAEGLQQLAQYASERNVKIVLETMSRFRTHLVNNAAQAMTLVNAAHHQNLYVVLDTYHLMTETRDFYQEIKTVGDRLWYFHACGSDRGVPGGDLVPWQEIFRGLKDINFDGVMLFETYNTTIPNFAVSRGIFNDICPDGEQFIKQGLEFFRNYTQ
jgi:D-psicose/D-tagatose/L-ribulose 3-epimerase